MNKIKKIIFYIVLILAGLYTLIPIYLMVKISLSVPGEVLTQHPTFLIHKITFNHWTEVFKSGNLLSPLNKSFIVATTATTLAVIIAAPFAYVVSRLRARWRYTIIFALLFSRMFPDVMIALPVAVKFIKWNLLDTTFGLVLAHLIPNLPFIAWILIGTFRAIPRALEEAAWIDGCHKVKALIKVIFPLALPGIVVSALFVWLNSWNEFIYAVYLSMGSKTLPLQIYFYQQRGDWFDSASYATILTIPVLIITFLLQKYLVSGYLKGAVKG